MLALAGCGTTADVPDDGKLKVAVTFDALKEFTQAVGGDKVDVYTLIPDGTEPHEFQPTTKTIKRLGQSQLFVYNGLGMEPWASKVVDAAKNTSLHTVNASQGITPIKLTDEEEVHEHGDYDPHIWLSLINAQQEVRNIADALSEADPANKGTTSRMPKTTTASSRPCRTNMPQNSKRRPARISSPATLPLPTYAVTSA